LCFGCKFFVDEKINPRPRVALSSERFEAFRRELLEYEGWVEEQRGREVNYSGTVFSVKPRLVIHPDRNGRPSFHGFLVVFRKGFVNRVLLEDFCYLRVSGRVQEKHRFRPGDRVDFYARFTESRGRIILGRINRVEIEDRGEGSWWNENRARVALRTGTILSEQLEKCLNCGSGCLIDVKEGQGVQKGLRRRLFCLEGVTDPSVCPHLCGRERLGEECGPPEGRSSSRSSLTTRSKAVMSQTGLPR
jgi:hypothetical protein